MQPTQQGQDQGLTFAWLSLCGLNVAAAPPVTTYALREERATWNKSVPRNPIADLGLIGQVWITWPWLESREEGIESASLECLPQAHVAFEFKRKEKKKDKSITISKQVISVFLDYFHALLPLLPPFHIQAATASKFTSIARRVWGRMKKPERRLRPPGCGSREMGRVPKAWEICLLLVQPTHRGPSGLRWWLHEVYRAETATTAGLLALAATL